MTQRFWLRPKWVVGHVLCLTLIVLFVNLGLWQLRRLDERQARNDLIEARRDAEPVDVDEALAGGPEAAEYRRVRTSGRWEVDETVLVRSRALNERAGYDVVTPLVTDGGLVVAVNRGFAPNGAGGEPAILQAVRPPSPRATVEGVLRASEERGRFGPQDAEGEQRVVNRVDLRRLQAQSDHELTPLFVQATAVEPAPPAVPIARPAPSTDEGPHLGYAAQWFIFATVGAVGWPLLLRKTARDERHEADIPA